VWGLGWPSRGKVRGAWQVGKDKIVTYPAGKKGQNCHISGGESGGGRKVNSDAAIYIYIYIYIYFDMAESVCVRLKNPKGSEGTREGLMYLPAAETRQTSPKSKIGARYGGRKIVHRRSQNSPKIKNIPYPTAFVAPSRLVFF